MTTHWLRLALLALAIALHGTTAVAQDAAKLIEQTVLLDNDSVRIVQLTYHPGADSDIHVNLGPEITIVQQGEIAVYTSQGRELLTASKAHFLPDGSGHVMRNETKQTAKFIALVLKKCD